jgi:hypothetical protein
MNLENTSQEQQGESDYTPTKKEQDDITYAVSFRDECAQQTQKERANWRRSLERYNLLRNVSKYDYIDDVHIGLTYDAVERVAAALPGREFGFRAKPTGQEDISNALLFSEALSHAWESADIMDGPSKMQIVKRSMALFGSCPVQLFWDTKFDKEGNLIKSDPGFYPLNIFNFYANKFVSEIEDCNEVGYISEMSPDAFKKSAKQLGYKNWKKVKGVQSGFGSQGKDANEYDHREGSARGDKLNIVRIFEVQSDDFILTIALDKTPVWLRKIPNKLGLKNCVLFRYKRNPLPNRLYGITDIERGGELEDSIQEAYNQMSFNHILCDNPGFTYNKLDRNIDPRTFLMAPGAGIPRGQDPNSLTELSFNSHLGESVSIIQNMLERYKRVVNVPDILAGVSDRGVQSASESNTLDANTKATFDSIVGEMKSTMYRVAYILKKMYEVYGPESISISINTPELIEKLGGTPSDTGVQVEMPKEDFVLNRDIEVVVDFTTQSKARLSNNLVQFLNITAQDQSIPLELRIICYQQYLTLNDLEDTARAFDTLINKKQSSDTAMADQENQKMANGQQLPPTPGATPAHTQRHVEFMRSNETGPEIDRLLKPHIEGEIAGLQNTQQGGSPSQEGGEVSQPSIPQTNPI